MDCVFNATTTEQLRSSIEDVYNKQISAMEATRSQYEADAAALEAQAANYEAQAQAQDLIASSAMKTQRYTDSEGRSRTRQVPDTDRRSAAAAQAASLRSQASAMRAQAAMLRAAAAAIGTVISATRSVLADMNTYLRQLVAAIQQTDLTYAERLAMAYQEILAYNQKLQKIYESFNDTFPLTSDNVTSLNSNNFGTDGIYLTQTVTMLSQIWAKRAVQGMLFEDMYDRPPTVSELNYPIIIANMRWEIGSDDIFFPYQISSSDHIYKNKPDGMALGSPAYVKMMEQLYGLTAVSPYSSATRTKVFMIKNTKTLHPQFPIPISLG